MFTVFATPSVELYHYTSHTTVADTATEPQQTITPQSLPINEPKIFAQINKNNSNKQNKNFKKENKNKKGKKRQKDMRDGE